MMIRIPRDKFLANHQKLHDSIFTGRLVYQHPFAHLDWEIVLVPGGGLRLEEDIFNALAKAASTQEDDELIATDFESAMVSVPHQESVIMSWNTDEFKKLLILLRS
jgi:hypothetical protein